MAIKQVPQIPIETTTPKTGGIAWHLELAVLRALQRLFNVISNPVKSLISIGLTEFVELLETEFIAPLTSLTDVMMAQPGISPALKDYYDKIKKTSSPGNLLAAIVFAIVGVMGYLAGPTSVTAKLEAQKADEALRSNIPMTGDAVRGMFHDLIKPDKMLEILDLNGVPNEYRALMMGLVQQYLSPVELANAGYRKLLSPTEQFNKLRGLGYGADEIAVMQELFVQIPPANDIIRMAVRDAWNETAVRTFGYDEDYPTEFGQWAEKLGIPAEWAKRYWRAHWVLPPVTAGYEMLHRDIIKPKELELLLRISDIPKFWRDRLIEMSYNVYTRVDTRRMYELHILDEDGVFKAYKEQGYDDEKAGKLTEWTIEEYGQTSKELSKSDIIGAYLDGLIGKEIARTYLRELKYGDEEIELLLSRADLKRQQDFEKEFVNTVKVMFVAGQIDEIKVADYLSQINSTGAFIEYNLKLWRVLKDRAVKRPTLKDMLSFYTSGVITYDEFVGEMHKQGYSETYIDWYTRLVETQISA